MKKMLSLISAGVLALSALTACEPKEKPADEQSKSEDLQITFPDDILSGATADIPDVTVDKYQVPDNEALNFVRNLKIGWNLGNTFDTTNVNCQTDLEYEKAWCGTYTTIEDIAAIKAAGFRTIRIPVSWHDHVDENFKINAEWMNRVKEVVDWCLACDLYVIVNTHHDNDEKFYYPDSAHLESSKKYLTAVWTQMGEAFAKYDDHVILESLNEPRLVNTNFEWWIDPNNAQCKDAISCINTLNQLFVDTIRGCGGGNETRYLMCPGYDASADGALNAGYVLPTDAQNRVIVSVHAYTPYSFALDKKGTDSFDMNNGTDTGEILKFMDGLYGKFVMNGIPVVIGEFGALNKDNLEERIAFSAYYIAAARGRGISCCWWDNNAFSGSGENFGLLYRKNAKFMYPDIVKALMKYAG